MQETPEAGRVRRIRPAEPLRSPCPLAAALDLVGDRWTLLLIRDMVFGKARFGEFLASSERITTNILADRLRKLERAGLIRAVVYQQHPPRREYVLTDTARALLPAMNALATWGTTAIEGAARITPIDSTPPEPPAPREPSSEGSGLL